METCQSKSHRWAEVSADRYIDIRGSILILLARLPYNLLQLPYCCRSPRCKIKQSRISSWPEDDNLMVRNSRLTIMDGNFDSVKLWEMLRKLRNITCVWMKVYHLKCYTTVILFFNWWQAQIWTLPLRFKAQSLTVITSISRSYFSFLPL